MCNLLTNFVIQFFVHATKLHRIFFIFDYTTMMFAIQFVHLNTNIASKRELKAVKWVLHTTPFIVLRWKKKTAQADRDRFRVIKMNFFLCLGSLPYLLFVCLFASSSLGGRSVLILCRICLRFICRLILVKLPKMETRFQFQIWFYRVHHKNVACKYTNAMCRFGIYFFFFCFLFCVSTNETEKKIINNNT